MTLSGPLPVLAEPEPLHGAENAPRLTDEEVAKANVFEKLLAGLAKSMTDMCSKLPERYDKLKARAELAQRVIAAAGQA